MKANTLRERIEEERQKRGAQWWFGLKGREAEAYGQLPIWARSDFHAGKLDGAMFDYKWHGIRKESN